MNAHAIFIVITFALLILHLVLRRVSYDGIILKRGKNFSVKQKICILKAVDCTIKELEEREKYKLRVMYGMCSSLKWDLDKETYCLLCNLYHNPDYYRKMGIEIDDNTNIHGYWWDVSDVNHRLEASRVLKYAVIND